MPSNPPSPPPAEERSESGPPTARARRWKRWLIGAVVVCALVLGAQTALRYKVAISAGSGELWGLWDCDATYITEGRPNLERVGCMVRLPGVGLRQALHPTPADAAERDPHTFLMGAQADDERAPGYDPAAAEDESPPHLVTLTPFWMQRFTVSVRQYSWCIAFGPCDDDEVATGGYFTYTPRSLLDVLFTHEGDDERPITGVTWHGAETYCRWIGGRLPTEAEWEFGARGGPLQRRYPWGDTPPTCGHAVFGGGTGGRCDVHGPTSASLHRSYGQDRVTNILHQAGNVWEWTADWYAPTYYASAPAKDPSGPDSGPGRVQRGGGWSDQDGEVLRAGFRGQMDPELKMPDVGFRCAADAVDAHPFTLLDDFVTDGMADWAVLGEGSLTDWTEQDGLLGAPNSAGAHALWRPATTVGPTLLSVRTHSAQSGSASTAILYGIQDAQNHYRAELYPAARIARIVRVLDGVEGVVAEARGLPDLPRSWITLSLHWLDGRHALDLGNQHLVTGEDATWGAGGIGLRVSGSGAVSFDSVFTTP